MIDTQREQILSHLVNIGPITPLEALSLYGCFRLGARIWDLRDMGYDIQTEWEESNGKRYARYRIVQYKESEKGQLQFA